jgi:uncharacterized protein YbaR (Trm112 family)
MKIDMMKILECPADKKHALKLHVFTEDEEICEGLIVCSKCLCWYPVREGVPEILPDYLREKKNEIAFLKKWKKKFPKKILEEGKPCNQGDLKKRRPRASGR